MAAFRELYHPDAIMRMVEGWPEPGPYFGRDAVMREYEQLREAWDADDVILIDHSGDVGDRVAVRFSWRGAGRGPGADLELTCVFTVRKGSILAAEYFRDYAEALEAVGLSER
jgi:hypothetical protein